MIEIVRDIVFFYFFIVLVIITSFFTLKERGIFDILKDNSKNFFITDDKDNEKNIQKIFSVEEKIKNELAEARTLNICICFLFVLLAWAILYYLFICYKKM